MTKMGLQGLEPAAIVRHMEKCTSPRCKKDMELPGSLAVAKTISILLGGGTRCAIGFDAGAPFGRSVQDIFQMTEEDVSDIIHNREDGTVIDYVVMPVSSEGVVHPTFEDNYPTQQKEYGYPNQPGFEEYVREKVEEFNNGNTGRGALLFWFLPGAQEDLKAVSTRLSGIDSRFRVIVCVEHLDGRCVISTIVPEFRVLASFSEKELFFFGQWGP